MRLQHSLPPSMRTQRCANKSGPPPYALTQRWHRIAACGQLGVPCRFWEEMVHSNTIPDQPKLLGKYVFALLRWQQQADARLASVVEGHQQLMQSPLPSALAAFWRLSVGSPMLTQPSTTPASYPRTHHRWEIWETPLACSSSKSCPRLCARLSGPGGFSGAEWHRRQRTV